MSVDSSDDIPELNRKSFENEIRTLTEVRHRNVIKLYGSCSWKGCLYFVYEYVERGSLKMVLYGVDGEAEVLGWGTRVKTVQGIAHAISHLHNDCSPNRSPRHNFEQHIIRSGFCATPIRLWNRKTIELRFIKLDCCSRVLWLHGSRARIHNASDR